MFSKMKFFMVNHDSEKQQKMLGKKIENRKGQCCDLETFRQKKFAIALCNPTANTFDVEFTKMFVRKEKRDVFKVDFLHKSIHLRELQSLADYRFEGASVCTNYDPNLILTRELSFIDVIDEHSICGLFPSIKCRGQEVNDDTLNAAPVLAESISSLSDLETKTAPLNGYVSCKRDQIIASQKYQVTSFIDDCIDKNPTMLFQFTQFFCFIENYEVEEYGNQIVYTGESGIPCDLLGEFLGKIKKNGGKLIDSVEDLSRLNEPIVCLLVSKYSYSTASKFVKQFHRELTFPSFVTESIEVNSLQELSLHRVEPAFCTNYNFNMLYDGEIEKKLYSYIPKAHAIQCKKTTCKGIGVRSEYYRSLYNDRRPIKKSSSKHIKPGKWNRTKEHDKFEAKHKSLIVVPEKRSYLENMRTQIIRAPKVVNLDEKSGSCNSTMSERCKAMNVVKTNKPFSGKFDQWLIPLLNKMMEVVKTDGTKIFTTPNEFEELCLSINSNELKGSGKSFKRQFYRMLETLPKNKDRIFTQVENSAYCYNWLELWAANIQMKKKKN